MHRRPPISNRTDTLFPYTPLFRSVTVIAGASQAVPPSFDTDLTGFDVHYVPDGWLTRRSSFRAERGIIAQRLTTALRLLAWPDHVRPDRKSTRLNSSH